MTSTLPMATAAELAALIAERSVTPVEVVEAHIRRIEALDPKVRAFVTLRADRAMAEAKLAEDALNTGEPLGLLHGLPIAVKDQADLAGEPSTYGIRALERFVPTETAPDILRLKAAGAIVIGKTNMPEFGHKAVTDNLFVGPTSTPFDLTHNAGGSSGGSAAAVAACFTPLAQGGDGGGSIRIPAALSGVYGLKPSWGRVPARNRPDAYAFALPMVCWGPMARTVSDAALMLQVIAGPDRSDPFSLPDHQNDFVRATKEDIAGRRAAYWPTFGGVAIARDVSGLVATAVQRLEYLGLEIDEISDDLGAPLDTLRESWMRGASLGYAMLIEDMRTQGLDLLGEYADQLSPSFAQYIDRGARLSAVEHRRENNVRSAVFDRLQDVLEKYDFILTPTLSVAGVPNVGNGATIGPSEVDGTPVDPLLGWSLCFPVNFTGHPAASIPAGFTANNHPVGLQIIGRRFRDDEVLAVSAALESLAPWYEAYRNRTDL